MTPRKATEAVIFIAILLCVFVAAQTTAHALAAILTAMLVAVQ